MLLRKIIFLLASSIIVSSQKSSDIPSVAVTVTDVIPTPSVEKSASLVPTDGVIIAPTPATSPVSSTPNSVVKNTDTASVLTGSNSISVSTASTPKASGTGNSTLTGSMPEISGTIVGDPLDPDLGESPREPVNPSADDLVDLTAYEIDVYAADVASGEHQTISTGLDEGAKVMLPVCPDVGATPSGTTKRATKKKVVFNCSPSSLTIPVYFTWITSKEKTPEEKAAMETKIAAQFAFLVSAYKLLKINLERKGVTQVHVNPVVTHHYKGLPESTFSAHNKINKDFFQQTRTGADDTLNVWIVEELYSYGKENGKPIMKPIGGFANFPGSGNFDVDGIVIVQNSIGSGQIVSSTDKCGFPVQRVIGGTLLHELGHWMGLLHTFQGGCRIKANDGLGGTAAFSDEGPGNTCCTQTPCNKGSTPRRNWNWMSYSSCRGTNENGLSQLASFTPDQKSRMYSQFLTFRRKKPCGAEWKREISTREEHAILDKRAADKATVLADLLLKDCSVAIQAVFQEDSIPLPKSVLQSYSSVASSMQAHPTTYPPGEERPATATHETAVPTATGSEDSSGKKPNGSVSNGDLGKASMFGFVGWFFGLLFML